MFEVQIFFNDFITSFLLLFVALGTLLLQWWFYYHQKKINQKMIEFEELKRFPQISYISDCSYLNENIVNLVVEITNESEYPILIWEIRLIHKDYENENNEDIIINVFENKNIKIDKFNELFAVGSREKVDIVRYYKPSNEIRLHSLLAEKQSNFLKECSIKVVYSSSFPKEDFISSYLDNNIRHKKNFKLFDKTFKPIN